MWTGIKAKVEHVNYIERKIEEYIVWMPEILPCGKMKVKIMKSNSDFYSGTTSVCIIRKDDNRTEGAWGGGETIEEALENIIKNFLEIVYADYPKEEYPDGVPQEAIAFAACNNF